MESKNRSQLSPKERGFHTLSMPMELFNVISSTSSYLNVDKYIAVQMILENIGLAHKSLPTNPLDKWNDEDFANFRERYQGNLKND
jgi:hypothetical protein